MGKVAGYMLTLLTASKQPTKSPRMFNNTYLSDATVFIHGVTLPVHLFIICTQSDYFKNAFLKFAEGSTRTMQFKEGSGAAYWRVFEYLYTGNYSDELSTEALQGE